MYIIAPVKVELATATPKEYVHVLFIFSYVYMQQVDQDTYWNEQHTSNSAKMVRLSYMYACTCAVYLPPLLSLYLYLHVHVHVYTSSPYTYTYMCLLSLYLYLHVPPLPIPIPTCTCTCIYPPPYTYTYMYMYMYIPSSPYTYTYMYMYMCSVPPLPIPIPTCASSPYTYTYMYMYMYIPPLPIPTCEYNSLTSCFLSSQAVGSVIELADKIVSGEVKVRDSKCKEREPIVTIQIT